MATAVEIKDSALHSAAYHLTLGIAKIKLLLLMKDDGGFKNIPESVVASMFSDMVELNGLVALLVNILDHEGVLTLETLSTYIKNDDPATRKIMYEVVEHMDSVAAEITRKVEA